MEKFVFILWLSGALAAGTLGASAQSAPAAAATNSSAAVSATNAPPDVPIKEVQPGIFEIGDVTVDKLHRTVSFPAKLNLASGPMEYFLVTSWGKIHESIFKTDTQPYRIHVGMLLLGAHGAGTNLLADGPPVSFISHPANVQIPGDDVSVEVAWTNNGIAMQRRAGEMIFNRQTNSMIAADAWAYNGSQMFGDDFIAQADGSIVSLVTDWAALVNNNGPGHDDDGIWTAMASNLPPTNLTVRMIFQLNDPKPKK